MTSKEALLKLEDILGYEYEYELNAIKEDLEEKELEHDLLKKIFVNEYNRTHPDLVYYDNCISSEKFIAFVAKKLDYKPSDVEKWLKK